MNRNDIIELITRKNAAIHEDKSALATEICRKTAQFLAGGGEITQIGSGLQSINFGQVWTARRGKDYLNSTLSRGVAK